MPIKYIPFYPHDFFNDPRLQQLEPKEQQQWLFLMARMMLTQATIPGDDKFIARTLDISVKQAKALVDKLLSVGLIKSTPPKGKLFELYSTRLSAEYSRAKEACEKATAKGKAAVAKRWQAKEDD